MALFGCIESDSEDDGPLLSLEAGSSGWASPIALSPSGIDGRTRYNFGKAMAIDGAGVIHVVWVEVQEELSDIDVRGRIYYQRSPDGGFTWLAPRALTPVYQRVGYPKLAAVGPYVYVVWHDDHEGTQYPYVRVSNNHGDSFAAARRVSNYPGGLPAVAAYGSAVHVVWVSTDASTGANEVFIRSSIDWGASWLGERMPSSSDPLGQRLTGDGISSWTPMVAAWGTHVYVVWTDERHNRDASGNPFDCGAQPRPTSGDDLCREEVYFRRSTSAGQTWGPEVRLTSWAPGIGNNAASVDADASGVHVSYFSKPESVNAIFYRVSHDDGVHFGPPVVIENLLASNRPSVAARGNQVDIAFWSVVSGVGAHIFHARSTNGGASFGSAAERAAGNHLAMDPQMALGADGTAHILYVDAAAPGSASRRIYYTRTLP